MKIILLTLACLFINILYSCKESKEPENLTFTNNFDNIKGWIEYNGYYDKVSYSSPYCLRLDTLTQFGIPFKIKFSEIGMKRSVKFSIMCLHEQTSAEAKLVITVNSPEKQNVFWYGYSTKEIIDESQKWFNVTHQIDIDTIAVKPQNDLLIYVWNTGTTPVLVDNYKIEFIN